MSRATTQHYYKGGRLSFYRTEYLSYILFLCSSCATLFVGITGNWLISLLAGLLILVRYVTKGIIFHKSALLLQQKPSIFYAPSTLCHN